jgi:multiple sugar transport system ATP-binding protein
MNVGGFVADVVLTNVGKKFGAQTVIDNLSLRVGDGEFMVFLGPSGCGKSTLLRMIAGLESVDEGEIRIGGQRVDNLPPGARGVAMVFQHYALYPHMTIRENMSFGLRNIGVKAGEIARRVDEAARMLEIEPLLLRKPAQLSGGQRQRVAIGRAIVKEPKAFLFDEPLSNLDAALRVRTRVELAQLHQRMKSTMVFVTHDQVEAMTLADRIAVMHDRRIEQIGTPMEIYTRPATCFVAGFVGSPAMNFLPVEITPAPGDFALVRLPDGSTLQTRIAPGGLPAGALKLGIRAEAIGVTAPGGGDTNATAQVIEQLGERTLIYARLENGAVLVAQDSGSSRVAVGDRIGIKWDGGAAHLFDAQDRGHHAAQ